jgi:hypothetical protein
MLTTYLILSALLTSVPDRLELVLTFDQDYAATVSEPRTLTIDAGHTTVVSDLDLGESVEGALLELVSRTSTKATFRVQVQYETSVSISNEGPHLDLVEWKHFTSEWRDIHPVTRTRFRVPKFSQEERSRFPKVSVMDLKEAVRAAGGDGWLELIRSVSGVYDAPAGVDISAIRVRVTPLGGGATKSPFILDFVIPMGC